MKVKLSIGYLKPVEQKKKTKCQGCTCVDQDGRSLVATAGTEPTTHQMLYKPSDGTNMVVLVTLWCSTIQHLSISTLDHAIPLPSSDPGR